MLDLFLAVASMFLCDCSLALSQKMSEDKKNATCQSETVREETENGSISATNKNAAKDDIEAKNDGETIQQTEKSGISCDASILLYGILIKVVFSCLPSDFTTVAGVDLANFMKMVGNVAIVFSVILIIFDSGRIVVKRLNGAGRQKSINNK